MTLAQIIERVVTIVFVLSILTSASVLLFLIILAHVQDYIVRRDDNRIFKAVEEARRDFS